MHASPFVTRVGSAVFALAVLLGGFLIGERSAAAQPTFTVTKNVYDGPEWWGTITFRNNGPVGTSKFTVEFDLPSGVHCTAEPESVPPGATLSPLTGSGSSARTVSNHCVYSWSNASPIAPGETKKINYSTDNNSTSFKSASNLQVSDRATCVGAPACLSSGQFCATGSTPACCAGLSCEGGKCVVPACKQSGVLCDVQNPGECCSSTCNCPVGQDVCGCG